MLCAMNERTFHRDEHAHRSQPVFISIINDPSNQQVWKIGQRRALATAGCQRILVRAAQNITAKFESG